MKKPVAVVGMSGGVDSSVAAYLLLQQGYEVIGLFMNNWEEDDADGVCTSAEDWRDVQSVCGKLKIPHYSVNFSREYYERVFKYFLDEYERGRTPNPDVLCNREVKFGPFADYAKMLGADYIATGHYCAVGQMDGEPVLLKAADGTKDQTYFLNQVKTAQLKNVLFPLSSLVKKDVRAIAEREGLVTSRKKDSTGICFIGERNFRSFLSRYLPAKPGDIVDTDGTVVGKHQGLMYYTLGQRRGLGIGGIAGKDEGRWYVTEKDLKTNRLIVRTGEGKELMSSALTTGEVNFIGARPTKKSFEATAKFRYRQPEQAVSVTLDEFDTAHICFLEPQRAVTPGQFAVLYDGERCLGGAVIEQTFPVKE